MNKLWYLKKLNLFKTLPEEEVKFISDKLVMKNYGKRQVIFEPQDRDKIFILKKGRVEIYQLTEDGKKIIVDVLGPGNFFGDIGIDDSNENFMEATADSFVCVIGKDEFFEMMGKHPKLANILVKELFAKIAEKENQVAALASDNILIKLKNLLFRLGKKYGENTNDQVTISTKFTHEELAEMIGVSRPTVTEMLGKLAENGSIKRQGKLISFDRARLFAV